MHSCFSLGCATPPAILILHFLKGIPISEYGCQASFISVEGSKYSCGCPPGFWSGVKMQEPALRVIFPKMTTDISESGKHELIYLQILCP